MASRFSCARAHSQCRRRQQRSITNGCCAQGCCINRRSGTCTWHCATNCRRVAVLSAAAFASCVSALNSGSAVARGAGRAASEDAAFVVPTAVVAVRGALGTLPPMLPPSANGPHVPPVEVLEPTRHLRSPRPVLGCAGRGCRCGVMGAASSELGEPQHLCPSSTGVAP